MRRKPFYHVTSSDNCEKILKEGLFCNEDGDIFVFEDRFVIALCPIMTEDVIQKLQSGESFPVSFAKKVVSVADTIAMTQVFIPSGAILRIDSKGITGDMLRDNVAESAARFQWIIKQKTIGPEHIKLHEMRDFEKSYSNSVK